MINALSMLYLKAFDEHAKALFLRLFAITKNRYYWTFFIGGITIPTATSHHSLRTQSFEGNSCREDSKTFDTVAEECYLAP